MNNSRMRSGGWVLAITLLGYWTFGKAFAYLGLPPLYVGETLLALAAIIFASRTRVYVIRHWTFWWYCVLSLLVAAQACLSVFGMGQNQLEVLRNVAMFYYVVFGYITFVYVSCTAHSVHHLFDSVVKLLSMSAPYILIGISASIIATQYFSDVLPTFPVSGVTMLYFKATDAILPLSLLLLLFWRGMLRPVWGWWALALAFIAAAQNRSAMLCLVMTFIVCSRLNSRTLLTFGALVITISAAYTADFKVPLGYREMSTRQLFTNVRTLLYSSDEDSEFDPSARGNVQWRLNWWTKIVEDALYNGRWIQGRGWGANLATDFGVVTSPEAQNDITVLRNPHNVCIGILGRGGVISALMYGTFYVGLLAALTRRCFSTSLNAAHRDMLSVLILYFGECFVNGSTDVFLESPQNAIPFSIAVGCAWFVLGKRRRQMRPPGRPPEMRYIEVDGRLNHA